MRFILITMSLFLLHPTNTATAQSANKVVVIPLGGSESRRVTEVRRKNLPAGEFVHGSHSPGIERGYSYSVGDSFRVINNSDVVSAGLTTSLDLPNGANMTSVTCYMQDQDSTYNTRSNSSFKVYRRSPESTSSEEIMTPLVVATSGNSIDMVPFEAKNSFIHPIVDNDSYFYHVRFFMQFGDNAGGLVSPPISTQIRFYGCSIFYEIDVITVID